MIDGVWAFLTAAENREVLSWLGGGLAALAIGGWTVVRFLVGRRETGAGKPSPPPRQEILADRGGRAAGRDIAHNSGNATTITTGVSGGHLALIVAITLGLALVAISQIGSRTTAEGGSSAVGGDVSGTTITVGQ